MTGCEQTKYDIGVAAHHFGEALHREISAKLMWPTDEGGGEGVVDEQFGVARRSDLGERGEIRDMEKRVGDRFGEEEFCLLCHRGANGGEIGDVDRGRRDTPGKELTREQCDGLAVEKFGIEDVIARAECGE